MRDRDTQMLCELQKHVRSVSARGGFEPFAGREPHAFVRAVLVESYSSPGSRKKGRPDALDVDVKVEGEVHWRQRPEVAPQPGNPAEPLRPTIYDNVVDR